MIVSRIEGGLGNQLFQVAFGMQIAKKHNTELFLDLGSYDEAVQHGLMLDRFQVTAKPIDERISRRIPSGYQPNPAPRWADWFRPNGLKRVKEKPFGFNEHYLNTTPDDAYLVGYWQSEHFFADVVDEVRAQFRPTGDFSLRTLRLRDRMLNQNSVALHVRRGDYVNNPTNASMYQNLSLEYYHNAVEEYMQSNEGVQVYVFSNDIPWCREHLEFDCPLTMVDHTSIATCHEDIELMKSAACCAIANSTFSWWGAWLNAREDKVVVAPNAWFRPGTLNDEFINASGWRCECVESLRQVA